MGADKLLGCIISPHGGKILSEVRSPVRVILSTLREYLQVYEGSSMARIMAMDQTGDGAGEGIR